MVQSEDEEIIQRSDNKDGVEMTRSWVMLRIERLGWLFGPDLLAKWPLGGLVNS